MFENAIYSVISPEGCASILWRDPSKSLEAAKAMKLTANELLKMKIIDEIIKEPVGGAHRDSEAIALEVRKTIVNHLNDRLLNNVTSQSANAIDLIQLGIVLRDRLDKELPMDDIDQVIIENQISPIANRMKTIQGMIIQHFIEKNFTNIKQISAFNKLKEFLGEHQKTTYNQRKKLGIQSCSNIICNNQYFNKWDQFFLTHKKKDDLADSFLQGWWYLKNLNII
jgi:hypothetical protein